MALRTVRRTAIPLVAALCILSIPAAAEARVPRCFGARATIVGTRRADTIRGTPRADVIVGLGGSDVINGRRGNDVVCAGDGSDRVLGGAGRADLLSGQRGNDAVRGGDGFDILVGGPGNDAFDGGAGVDAISFFYSPAAVTVDLSAGTVLGEGSDTVAGVEEVEGSSSNDTFTGDAGPNIFFPEQGDDVVDGGEGEDAIAFTFSSGGVTVDLTAGTAVGEGSDTLRGIEDIEGSDNDDVITGDVFANVISGNDGADTINGSDGDDRMDGGPGIDVLDGGVGADTCTTGETVSNCEA